MMIVTSQEAERFARLVISRGWRLAEVAVMEEIDQSKVAERLLDPEVQAQMARLTTTGEAATTPVMPRELSEIVGSMARLTPENYKTMCRVDAEGTPIVNAGEYWGIRQRACELQLKMLLGPGGSTKAIRKLAAANKATTIKAEIIK